MSEVGKQVLHVVAIIIGLLPVVFLPCIPTCIGAGLWFAAYREQGQAVIQGDRWYGFPSPDWGWKRWGEVGMGGVGGLLVGIALQLVGR